MRGPPGARAKRYWVARHAELGLVLYDLDRPRPDPPGWVTLFRYPALETERIRREAARNAQYRAVHWLTERDVIAAYRRAGRPPPQHREPEPDSESRLRRARVYRGSDVAALGGPAFDDPVNQPGKGSRKR